MEQLDFLEQIDQTQSICPVCNKGFEKNDFKRIVCSKKCRNRKYRLDNKELLKEQRKQYYLNNKEKIREKENQYRRNNKEKINEQAKQYRFDNKEKIKERKKQYCFNNEEKIKEIGIRYRLKNKEKIKERKKQYYFKNKEMLKEQKKQYLFKNKEKIKERKKQYRFKNKEKIKEQAKQYRFDNKEKIKEIRIRYLFDNKEKLKEIQKQYYLKNKEKLNKKRNQYRKVQYQKDIEFRIKQTLRKRMYFVIKRQNTFKTSKTKDLIGCDWNIFKSYFEPKFKEGMTWENYGHKGWHIDHIIPCASFDLTDPEQQKKCFHYTNLQPLWWYENLSKGDKILEEYTKDIV